MITKEAYEAAQRMIEILGPEAYLIVERDWHFSRMGKNKANIAYFQQLWEAVIAINANVRSRAYTVY